MQFLILKLINNLVSNADSVNLELPKNWHFNQKPGDFYADDKVSHRFNLFFHISIFFLYGFVTVLNMVIFFFLTILKMLLLLLLSRFSRVRLCATP